MKERRNDPAVIEKTKEHYAVSGVTPWHCIAMITLKTLIDAGMVGDDGYISIGSSVFQLGEFIWAQGADDSLPVGCYHLLHGRCHCGPSR